MRERWYKWAVVAMPWLVCFFNYADRQGIYSVFALLKQEPGVLIGGVLADRLSRKYRGGRMMTQNLGLYGGIPFIFLVGWTLRMPVLILAMAFFGLLLTWGIVKYMR